MDLLLVIIELNTLRYFFEVTNIIPEVTGEMIFLKNFLVNDIHMYIIGILYSTILLPLKNCPMNLLINLVEF